MPYKVSLFLWHCQEEGLSIGQWRIKINLPESYSLCYVCMLLRSNSMHFISALTWTWLGCLLVNQKKHHASPMFSTIGSQFPLVIPMMFLLSLMLKNAIGIWQLPSRSLIAPPGIFFVTCFLGIFGVSISHMIVSRAILAWSCTSLNVESHYACRHGSLGRSLM